MSAADSLILADVVELLGGGVTSAHPLCPGAQMTLTPGYDRGAPQPQTSIVSSLLLDGSRPIGRRDDNRTISLPIKITGPSRAILNGARELLMQLTAQDTWRLTWTPDPGTGTALPLIFDCFKATATPGYDGDLEDELVTHMTLTFPAMPYGRSDTLTTLVFPTPSVSFPVPPLPVRVDDFTTVSTTTQTSPGWWTQSTQHILDSYSAHWDWSNTDRDSGPFYSHTLGSPVNITGLTNLVFQFGLGTDNYAKWHAGNVTFAITLSDNSGHTLSFGGVTYCVASNTSLYPTWTQVTFAIPTSSTFDYTNVASYSIHAWRFVDRDGALELDSDAYLNGLTASATAANPIAAVRGTLYQIGAPGGTARAPMSTQFQAPPVTTPTTTTFTTPGITTWTPPAGVTTVKVRVKGAGGVGGARTTAGQGGGAGGGGGIGEDLYPVVPGQPLNITVGAAGATGGFPTLVTSYYNSQDGRNTNSLVTPSFTPAANEVLVVKAGNEDGGGTFGTPTGGGLTWTQRVNIGGTGTARAALWTATVSTGGTPMTVTLPAGGTAVSHAMVVERWSGAKLAGSPAVMNSSGSGAPSGTCTTAANNSVVSWINADWNAQTGTRTYRGTPTEEQYTFLGGKYTGYWAYQTAATAGAQTCGLSAPTGQLWSMVGIEVQAFNTGALTDGGYSTFDLLTAPGGASVPSNTTTGGAGGNPPITNLRAFLTSPQTDFESGIGTWVAGSNCTIAQTAAQAHGGTKSLQLTSTAGGDMTAQSTSVANTDVVGQGMPVLAGGFITVSAWFRSAVSARTCQAGATFVDVNGAAVGSGVYLAGSADSSAGWTQVSGSITVPTNAVWAAFSAKVAATGGASEVHYVDDAQMYPGAVWAGGTGANASTTGGGGGSSAGDDAAGANGSGQTGGTAPSGGGSGGNGGAAGANNGSAGSAPGGGGGGASSTGANQTGGAGANGKVAITYTPPLSQFKTLLAHSPSYMAPPTLNPLIPVGAGLDPPDGREYVIASPVAGLNARYYGTYTIIVYFSTVNTPANSRTVTVTFKQYDYPGGPSTSLAVARTLTPNTESPPIANGMIIVGELTLPVRDIAADNTAAYFTVAVNSTNSSDRALDVLVLDVRGQTAAINVSSGSGHVNYYMDEPGIDRDWGRILASDYDRPQATSILDQVAALSGGPLVIDPASAGWLLAYSADAGAPGLTATYYPRWRDARLS